MYRRNWAFAAIFLMQISFAEAEAQKNPCVLWLNSFGVADAWSQSFGKAVQDIIRNYNAELKVYHMHSEEKFSAAESKKKAAKAAAQIHASRPDVVIVSGDIASEYVVMPFFKNKTLPIIFCGLDRSLEFYGYPYGNTTGILESDRFAKLIYAFTHFRPIKKVGYLFYPGYGASADNGISTVQGRYRLFNYPASNYQQWQDFFIRAQEEVDVLVLGAKSFIEGWENDAAVEFVLHNTKIPTGCLQESMSPLTLICCAAHPEEQASWVGESAIKIIGGMPANAIAIQNDQSTKMIVNLKVADAGKINLPKSFRDKADKLIR